MAQKRAYESDDYLSREFRTKVAKKYDANEQKKHSLDSDEEDEVDESQDRMHDDDIEGEEEGTSGMDGETRMTAFNMQEEMELGHFDKQGHFIWKNEKEVRDNWLDNIDWHKVKENSKFSESDGKIKGLGEESDSEDEDTSNKIDEMSVYEKIIAYMQPKENINKALRRLGGDLSKLSSVERLKRKKAGTLNVSKEVTELTELANQILNTGNMDIYQETYEQIKQKIDGKNKKAMNVEAESDMFSDTFDAKEKPKEASTSSDDKKEEDVTSKELLWVFKWKQDDDKLEGPFNTVQMHKWSEDGYFKTGVWVRKQSGEDTNFYSSNRIDFELYL